MKPLLLHVCCGPCATHAIERLMPSYAVTAFFSNSNVATREEYEKRLATAEAVAGHFGISLVADTYDHDAWREHIRGLEAAPEGEVRCRQCFAFNLQRAAAYARAHAFEVLTTTLSISPHKDTPTLFDVGRELEASFLEIDFKKQDGFKRSIELSKQLGLYRQSFCGCEFSQRENRD